MQRTDPACDELSRSDLANECGCRPNSRTAHIYTGTLPSRREAPRKSSARMTRTIRLAEQTLRHPVLACGWPTGVSLDCRFQGLWGSVLQGPNWWVAARMIMVLVDTRSRWLAWAASDKQATTPDNVELEPLSGMRCHEINPPVLLNPKNPDSCCT